MEVQIPQMPKGVEHKMPNWIRGQVVWLCRYLRCRKALSTRGPAQVGCRLSACRYLRCRKALSTLIIASGARCVIGASADTSDAERR